MTRPAQCNTCRFWRDDPVTTDPNDAGWSFGHCRFQPPTLAAPVVAALMPALRYGQQEDPEVDTVSLTAASLYPATGSTDWCGRYEATAIDPHPAWAAEWLRLRLKSRTLDLAPADADIIDARTIAIENEALATPAETAAGNHARALILAGIVAWDGASPSAEAAQAVMAEAIALAPFGRAA